MVVDFTDGFQRVLQLAVIVEPLSDARRQFAGKTELPGAATGVADGQNGEGVALTAGALGTAAGMADGALDQGAAQNQAGAGQVIEQPSSSLERLFVCHPYR